MHLFAKFLNEKLYTFVHVAVVIIIKNVCSQDMGH